MGYGHEGSWHYTPDPVMAYYDNKSREEIEKRRLYGIEEKYYKTQKLLKEAGFQSVEELIKAYRDLQKYHAHDDKYIEKLRCEILALSE